MRLIETNGSVCALCHGTGYMEKTKIGDPVKGWPNFFYTHSESVLCKCREFELTVSLNTSQTLYGTQFIPTKRI